MKNSQLMDAQDRDVETGWTRPYREGYDAGLAGRPFENPHLDDRRCMQSWNQEQWAGGWNRGFSERRRRTDSDGPPESQRAGSPPPADDAPASVDERVPCSYGPFKPPDLSDST